ncbi:hypothetical protein, partial [Streptomyces sp. NPDC047014]|uniref:hypothetical protein n=1 Tax=Streptomyces sp. NPDC047014 TaxID=3155736 RepID=UPI0033D68E82
MGYIMGMLAHEIGLHPLASKNTKIPEEEDLYAGMPLQVPGLETLKNPRFMNTLDAGQADHVMAAFPHTIRHGIYRDIVVEMAEVMARHARVNVAGAKAKDVTDLIDTYLMDLASIAVTNDHRGKAILDSSYTARAYNAYKSQLAEHLPQNSPVRALLPSDKSRMGVLGDFAKLASYVGTYNSGDSIQRPAAAPTPAPGNADEARPRLPQADGNPTPDTAPAAAEPVLRPFKLGDFEFTNLNQTDKYLDRAVRIIELLDEHPTIKQYVAGRPVRITLHVRTTETPADVRDLGDEGVQINLASYYFEKYDMGYIMGMLAHEIGLHPLASQNTKIPEEEDLYARTPLPVPGLETLKNPRFMNTLDAGQADHIMAAFPQTIRHGIYRDIVVEMAEVMARHARVNVAGARARDVTDLIDTYLMDLASIAVTNDHRGKAVLDPAYTARAYNAYKSQLAEHLPQNSPVRALLPSDKSRFGVLGDFTRLASNVGTYNSGDSIQQPAAPEQPAGNAGEARPRLPESGVGTGTAPQTESPIAPPTAPRTSSPGGGARDHRPRFVVRSGFDARRFSYRGEPVTDLTVRIALRGTNEEATHVFDQLQAGVEEFLNAPEYRLPNGDRLHVTVELVDPTDTPHLTVDLAGRDRAMDQVTWWADAAPVQFVHELTHQLGLRDEYRDTDSPQRPHILGSLLGDIDEAPEDASLTPAGLRDRHLALLGALIGDITPAPQQDDDGTWAQARETAAKELREAVWVDPVSLPRPADSATATGVPAHMQQDQDQASALRPFKLGDFEFTNLNQTEKYLDRAVRIIGLLDEHPTIKQYVGGRPVRITLHVRTTETPADVRDLGDEGVQINLASYYFEKYDMGYIMGMLAHEIGLHPLASKNTKIPEEEDLYAGMPLQVPGLETLNNPRFMNTLDAGQADHVMAAFPHTIRHGIYRDIVVEMAEVMARHARVGAPGAKAKDVTDLIDTYLMDLASIAVTNDHRGKAVLDPAYTARSYNAYKSQLAEHLPQNSPVRALLPSDKSRFGVLGDFTRLASNVGTYNSGDSIQRPATVPTPAPGNDGEARPRLPQADNNTADTTPTPAQPVLRPFKLGDFEFTNLNQTEKYLDKAVRIIGLLDEHPTIKQYVAGRPVRITLHVRTTETPADVRDLGDEGVQINLASYYFEKYETGYIMGMLAHEIGLHPLASKNTKIPEEEDLYAGMPLHVPGLESLKNPRFMNTLDAGQADHVMAAFPHTIRHGIYRDIVVEMAEVMARHARVNVAGAKAKDVTDLIDTYLMDLASIAVTNDHRGKAVLDPAYTARSYNAYKSQLAEHLPQNSPVRALLPSDKSRFGVLGDFTRLASNVGTYNSGDSIQQPAVPTPAPGNADEARPRLPESGADTGTAPRTESSITPPTASPGHGARDRRPRFVVRSGFDARRFSYRGEPVTDLTVRIALRGTDEEATRVFGQLEAGVQEFLNAPEYRLPSGDRLHVTVELVDPADAPHLTVDLAGRDRAMDQITWWADAAPVQFVHELTHQLGLRDEYRDTDSPQRPHILGSLLGGIDEAPEDSSLAPAGLRDRHLALLGALIGDVTPAPQQDDDGTDGSWAQARETAAKELREAVWVDPVSLPRPADSATATGVPAHMQQDQDQAQASALRPFKLGDFEFTNLNQTEKYLDRAVRIIELLDEHPTIKQYVAGRPVRITLHVRTTETPADVRDLGDQGVQINLASYYFEKYDMGYIMGMLAHEIGLHPLASKNTKIPEEEDLYARMPLPVPGLETLKNPRFMNTLDAGQADHVMAAFPHTIRHGIYRDIVVEMAEVMARHARVNVAGAKAKDVTDLIDTYLMDLASIAVTNDHRGKAVLDPAYTARSYNAYKSQLAEHLPQNSPVRALLPSDKSRFGVLGDFTRLASNVGTYNSGDSIQRPAAAPTPAPGNADEARPRLPQADGNPTPDTAPAAAEPVLRPFKLGDFEFTNLNQTEKYLDKAVRIIGLLDEHPTIKQYVGGRPVRITLHVRTTETPADVRDLGDEGVQINLASYYFEKYDMGYIMGMLAHEIGLHPLASKNTKIPEEEDLYAGMPLQVPGLETLNNPRFMNTLDAGQADHVMAAFPHTIRHGIYRDIVVEMAEVMARHARVGAPGAKAKDVTDLIDTYLMDLASIAVTNDHRGKAVLDPAYTARSYNAYKSQLAEHLPQNSPVRALLPSDKSRFGVLGDFTRLASNVGTYNSGDSIQRPAVQDQPAGNAGEARPRLPESGAGTGTAPQTEPPTASPGHGARDRRPRFVVRSGFDARRFSYRGESVTDLTVRIALRGTDEEATRVFGQLEAGVEEFLNAPEYRLPNGDRLHVTVELVDPTDAPHLTVDLAGRDRAMDQITWWADAAPVQFVHELTHQLGLRDEYRDTDSPQRPHILGSLLGDIDEAPEDASLTPAGLRDRHLALLGALIGDVTPASQQDDEGTDGSWAQAREAAAKELREAVWVDPVSLPRPADSTTATEIPAHMQQEAPALRPFKLGDFEFTNLNQTEKYLDRAVRIIGLLDEHPTIKQYVGGRPVRITLHVRTTETPADVRDLGDEGVQINLASYYFEKYDMGYIMGMLAHEIGLHP